MAKYQVVVRNCPNRAVYHVSVGIIRFSGENIQTIQNKLEAKQDVLVSGLTEWEAKKLVKEVRSWRADAIQKIEPEIRKPPAELPLFLVVLEPGHSLSSKALAQITGRDPGDLEAMLRYQTGRRKGRDRKGDRISTQPPCPVTIWLGQSEAVGVSIAQQIVESGGSAYCRRYL